MKIRGARQKVMSKSARRLEGGREGGKEGNELARSKFMSRTDLGSQTPAQGQLLILSTT